MSISTNSVSNADATLPTSPENRVGSLGGKTVRLIKGPVSALLQKIGQLAKAAFQWVRNQLARLFSGLRGRVTPVSNPTSAEEEDVDMGEVLESFIIEDRKAMSQEPTGQSDVAEELTEQPTAEQIELGLHVAEKAAESKARIEKMQEDTARILAGVRLDPQGEGAAAMQRAQQAFHHHDGVVDVNPAKSEVKQPADEPKQNQGFFARFTQELNAWNNRD